MYAILGKLTDELQDQRHCDTCFRLDSPTIPVVAIARESIHIFCANKRDSSIGKFSWSMMLTNVLSPSASVVFSESLAIDFSKTSLNELILYI